MRICPDCKLKCLKKYQRRCDKCTIAREKYTRHAYYLKHQKKLKAYRIKYRKDHLEQVREGARKTGKKWYRSIKKSKERLLDDMVKNPGRYLKEVPVAPIKKDLYKCVCKRCKKQYKSTFKFSKYCGDCDTRSKL